MVRYNKKNLSATVLTENAFLKVRRRSTCRDKILWEGSSFTTLYTQKSTIITTLKKET